MPLAVRTQCASLAPLSRPDPTFVAQLIATAEQLPQTRVYRRAAPADALSAYGAGQRKAPRSGLRMRQIA
ncbi:hypothetical protein [Bradyrhizobium sp.]|uniref:hypothetical protein n=1 Tax=Bradyrhizobium sp. TaxID=376 RepID=UPI0025C58E99|nr:hypothetical protein [Bradyrhizobium sp.]